MSGRKDFLRNKHLVSAGDMSGNITSAVIGVPLLDNLGFQFNCVGTSAGTFDIQVSGDYAATDGVVTNTGNWVALALNPVPTCAGATIYLSVNIQQIAFPYLRVVYTRTGGTGTLDVWVCGKML